MSTTGLYALVPAAGVGRRFGAPVPKQYAGFAGATVIVRTLQRLQALPELDGIVVAVDSADSHWSRLVQPQFPDVVTVAGGAERARSVLNGLDWLEQQGAGGAWVLVHDSVRPCVPAADLRALLDSRDDEIAGALLVRPLHDTVKRIERDRVVATEDRDSLRAALTPQLFRVAELRSALADAVAADVVVTDEAMAVERAGGVVRFVEGDPRNIKITNASDLAVAELFYHQLFDAEAR